MLWCVVHEQQHFLTMFTVEMLLLVVMSRALLVRPRLLYRIVQYILARVVFRIIPSARTSCSARPTVVVGVGIAPLSVRPRCRVIRPCYMTEHFPQQPVSCS